MRTPVILVAGQKDTGPVVGALPRLFENIMSSNNLVAHAAGMRYQD